MKSFLVVNQFCNTNVWDLKTCVSLENPDTTTTDCFSVKISREYSGTMKKLVNGNANYFDFSLLLLNDMLEDQFFLQPKSIVIWLVCFEKVCRRIHIFMNEVILWKTSKLECTNVSVFFGTMHSELILLKIENIWN